MSQFFVNSAGGGGTLPPQVPTSFVADIGTAIPAGNVLNVPTAETSTNKVTGIQTTGVGNIVTTILTNRISGATVTTGTQSVIIVNFPLGVSGTYLFYTNIVANDITASIGAAYASYTAVNVVASTPTIINNATSFSAEQGTFAANQVVYSISGNNLVITVTGTGADTIDWLSLTTYIFTS